MKKIFVYMLAMLTLALTSCEEVIDYELDTAESKLVVEGLVTNQPGPYYVRLSSTKGYLNEGATPGVNGASITITDSDGTVDQLVQVSEGLYQTTKLQGKPGHTYYFKAIVNGKEYTAQSYMPSVAPIEKLTFSFEESSNDEDEGYHPHLHFTDPAGKGNAYRWNVFVNGNLDPDELAVFNDEIFDGKYGDVDMQFGLKQGDKVKVELYSLDKPAFNFWVALVNQQNTSGGPFESTPANAPSNISGGVIGYFGASAVSVVEGVAQ